MNKKKKIIILVGILAGVLLLGNFLRTIYLNIKELRREHTPAELVEMNKTNQVLNFSDIVSKADFGKFTMVNLSAGNCADSSQFCGTVFDTDRKYHYKNVDMIDELTNELAGYEYTVLAPTAREERTERLWTVWLCGYNELVLRMDCFKTADENTQRIIFDVEDDCFGIKSGNWFDKNSFEGMYVDSSVSQKVYDVFRKYTAQMSLAETESKIMENVEKIPLYEFLSYEHEFEKDWFNPKTRDDYFTYKQQLSDYEGYLRIYSLERYVFGESKPSYKKTYIFKIELYDASDCLQRELYADMENYEKDKF